MIGWLVLIMGLQNRANKSSAIDPYKMKTFKV